MSRSVSPDPAQREALRALPAVGVVVESLRRRSDRAREADSELLTFLVRRVLDRRRREILDALEAPGPSPDSVVEAAERALERWDGGSSTCRVINGTGIVLHSGLGRAVLPESVLRAIDQASGYVLLEVDPEAGKRRRRDAFVEDLLCHLTGAEAALVVNNNAAATILLLNTLAAGRGVVVSRSQMVEIGGSFRMPDVMEASGCRLVEVGTTNRSYPADYERAVDETVAAVMLVHTSNYRLVGFTAHPGIEELVAVGRKTGVPVMHDLGSGCLVPPEQWPVADEPPVAASLAAGADVACFSGDKLIGACQAGIIVGRREWVEKARKNPLARALRIDKLSCIALETALKQYFEPSRLEESIPTLGMLALSADELAGRARILADRLREQLGKGAIVETVPATSEMGSGTLPAIPLETTCVAVTPRSGLSVEALARSLRLRPVPVFTRIKDGAVWIDPRTLRPGESLEVVEAVSSVLSSER